ncbi:putative phospholipase B-like lamina ancestor [Rhagoletis pomonella]|uniref:putative phospholipase B-like lamina ancestor n=1 Tax=Rhagoletis pomonella TaxID=28610 RepID=UPI00177B410B|nr:putative phospholipase B-like lamina ancestor [Rhagoletis pomonella]XP_036337130.1 putative phospholipase B-like lamina ancestor [Rhagoletis pomonella]XP_036337131.1 putative phospholipase B-like lamina ancestor [Rhagoletis pomonella]XP_036337132.1 putative phospholipase B-like lamina ancestor [Rhagoletis pomonella]
MLKVVGASWQKTRIGTYILIGAGLLVIGAFFISYMDRPKYNGTYCATAFWSKQTGFHIEYWKQQNDLLNIPKGAARVCYKDSIYENGWAQIEVETQRTYPDWVQAFGAGILEGSLTWNNIYNQWKNTIESSCERDESSQNFCTWLRDLLDENYIRIKETAVQRGEHDHYWHQISLYFSQLEGLETGYIRGASRARSDLEEEIPFSDFLLLNAAADIQDLKIYYENFVWKEGNETADVGTEDQGTALSATSEAETGPKNFFLPSATMLTKIFQTADSPTWRLLFGHSTAGSYASMLRIQKRYKFHYHFSPNQRSNTVPGVDITFTGYPGILGSTDDFYIVKGRQVQSIVGGVGIKNENLDLWKAVNVTQALPLAARVMAANRIAQNRRTWAKAMSRHPFTGCKQWITVDLNKLRPQDNLYVSLAEDEKHDDAALPLNAADEAAINERHNRNKGLVWIVEQLPGRMHLKDVSEKFLSGENSTWIANGVPYFDEMLQASGVAPDSAYLEMKAALDDELTNLEAVDQFMRNHGFRGDLMGEESVAYGNIDIKLFSYNAQIGISDYHAFAGPIFIRLQHVQPREAIESTASESTDIASNLKDERLSVSIDDAAQLAELERIAERRSVRNDMQAIAMRQVSSGPFKWSEIVDRITDIEHKGHPDEFNFGKVAPHWAW